MVVDSIIGGGCSNCGVWMCANEFVGEGLRGSPHILPESECREGGNASASTEVGFVQREFVRAPRGHWRSKRSERRMNWVPKNQAAPSLAIGPSRVIEPSLSLSVPSLESPSEDDHCGLIAAYIFQGCVLVVVLPSLVRQRLDLFMVMAPKPYLVVKIVLMGLTLIQIFPILTMVLISVPGTEYKGSRGEFARRVYTLFVLGSIFEFYY